MSNAPESRLIGYARVSTTDQDLSLQRRALVAYGVQPEHIFEEHASGGKMNRPALSRALRSMRKQDTIVVWKLDRLGRTLSGVLEVLKDIEREGVGFVSLTEKFDTTTPMGNAMLHFAMVMAQLERDLIAERTKAGIALAKERGARFGQPGKITDNPKRLAEARRIIEEGVENVSAQEAVARLNAVDPKAKPIQSAETWRRWRRIGCPGAD